MQEIKRYFWHIVNTVQQCDVKKFHKKMVSVLCQCWLHVINGIPHKTSVHKWHPTDLWQPHLMQRLHRKIGWLITKL